MTRHLRVFWEELWWGRGSRTRLAAALVTAALVLASVALVYVTGGTRYVYAHSAYLPIVFAGVIFGPLAGAATALAVGIGLGPWMPLETGTQLAQPLDNWLVRCAFFVATGVLTGLLALRLRESSEQQARLHSLDQATGLPNRTVLEQRVEALQAGTGGAEGWCLLMLRLNTLGRVIETLGAGQAQLLWEQVIQRVRQSHPGRMEVFRVHAEQIALLLHQDEGAACDTAKALVATLRPPILVNGIPLELDASAGITPLGRPPDAADEISPLLSASLAAAQAHSLGQDVHIRAPEEGRELRRRLHRLGELPQAIEQGQLELHYQPKVSLASGRVVGAEALLRWQHPHEGLLLPAAFLPMAEETRLIEPLTGRVLDLAGKAAANWQGEGLRLKLAVNLSVRNLGSSAVVDHLRQLLERHELPPGRLEVEVTESAIMAAPEESAARLQEIADLGIGVSIDDFGAGHSSLAYLTRLPADTLKLDRSLVVSLASSERSRQILAAIGDLAARLGMTTVAEGVEDERILSLVRAAGLIQVQGYLIARPAPEKAFLEWLEANPHPLPPP